MPHMNSDTTGKDRRHSMGHFRLEFSNFQDNLDQSRVLHFLGSLYGISVVVVVFVFLFVVVDVVCFLGEGGLNEKCPW